MFLKKFITIFIVSCSLFVSATALSADQNFNCVLTITKPQSWHKQTVIIDLLDFNTKDVIARFDLAAADPAKQKKGVYSVSKTFNCGIYEQTQLQAHYFPAIWSTNKGKKYLSKEVFRLSAEIKQAIQNKAKNLDITVEFPKDFLDVPLQVGI